MRWLAAVVLVALVSVPAAAGEQRAWVKSIPDDKTWQNYSRALNADQFGKFIIDVKSDDIYFMLITRAYFATFTDKPIADPNQTLQVSTAFSQDSREEVDAIIAKGLAAGGVEPKPAQDYGFMYSRDLDDPDGNSLGFIFMEPAAAEQGPEAYMASQADASA